MRGIFPHPVDKVIHMWITLWIIFGGGGVYSFFHRVVPSLHDSLEVSRLGVSTKGVDR